MFSPSKNMSASRTGTETNQGTSSRPDDSMDISVHSDYYGGDFVEDGSFLVLNTDGLSLSPSTPPEAKSDEEPDADKNTDIEILGNEEGFETPSASITKSQVLGEDPESSVGSSCHSQYSLVVKQENEPSSSRDASQPANAVLTSLTNMSMASGSSASTEANLIESGEEVNLLMAENKKLAELLADSNEKMKQCITTTEKLKADHEEYKKKHEASRELINQLRKENEQLVSELNRVMKNESDLSQSLDRDRELAAKQESLERHYHTISELNERLNTVLTVNGSLNDQLLKCQKNNESMLADLELLRSEHEKQMSEKVETLRKVEVLTAEIDSGRQAIAKFKERHAKYEDDLACAKSTIHSLEEALEEKTKLTDSLRHNMEDVATALERCNLKLNQKEQENSLLTTQLAAIRAETEGTERLQVLQMQCQTYQTDFEKIRGEKAKLIQEKEALAQELNNLKQELQGRNLNRDQENIRGASADRIQVNSGPRNDNSAVNANESLPSPLTSLPTVAGQFVGFVRRELLGWEDLSGHAEVNQGTNEASATGSSETVVQQPKQEAIPPCPICRKIFPTLEKLQRHASNCGIEAEDGEPDDPFVFP